MYKLLFICRHNAVRSVIAQSLAMNTLSEQFEIESGGSEPKGQIDPVVQSFLSNNELPQAHRYSHSWEERTKFLPDVVIILCDSLHQEPVPKWLSGGIRVNWQLDVMPKDASDSEKYAYCEQIALSLQRRIDRLGANLVSGLSKESIRQCVVELSTL